MRPGSSGAASEEHKPHHVRLITDRPQGPTVKVSEVDRQDPRSVNSIRQSAMVCATSAPSRFEDSICDGDGEGSARPPVWTEPGQGPDSGLHREPAMSGLRVSRQLCGSPRPGRPRPMANSDSGARRRERTARLQRERMAHLLLPATRHSLLVIRAVSRREWRSVLRTPTRAAALGGRTGCREIWRS